MTCVNLCPVDVRLVPAHAFQTRHGMAASSPVVEPVAELNGAIRTETGREDFVN